LCERSVTLAPQAMTHGAVGLVLKLSSIECLRCGLSICYRCRNNERANGHYSDKRRIHDVSPVLNDKFKT